MDGNDGGKNEKKIVMIRTLGKGSFGKVKEALHTLTDEHLAVKILEKVRVVAGGDQVRVQREMAILKKVHHPNIVQVYEIVETPKYFFFLMEIASQGELSTLISARGALAESETRVLFGQLVSAVAHLHSLGISHRDIKPQNVLLDSAGNVKLSDFGLGSFFAPAALLETPCGSPCFAAPEVITGKPYRPEPSDVWGLGITLFNMLVGKLPFDEPTKKELYAKIQTVTYENPSTISVSALRLIKRLLVREPKTRPAAAEILSDPWFNGSPPPVVKEFEIDRRIAWLAAEKTAVEISKLLPMLKSHERNKYTMTYWLYLRKKNANKLTPEEVAICQRADNYKDTFQSTAADLVEVRTRNEKSSDSVDKRAVGTSFRISNLNDKNLGFSVRPLPQLRPKKEREERSLDEPSSIAKQPLGVPKIASGRAAELPAFLMRPNPLKRDTSTRNREVSLEVSLDPIFRSLDERKPTAPQTKIKLGRFAGPNHTSMDRSGIQFHRPQPEGEKPKLRSRLGEISRDAIKLESTSRERVGTWLDNRQTPIFSRTPLRK